MAGDEAKMTRLVQREIGRRRVDSTRLVIRFSHGSVYLCGYLAHLRGHEKVDLTAELNALARALRTKGGIRDVHWEEVVFR